MTRYKLYRERTLKGGAISVSVMAEWPDGTHSHEEILLTGEQVSQDKAIRAQLHALWKDRSDGEGQALRPAEPSEVSKAHRRREYARLDAEAQDAG